MFAFHDTVQATSTPSRVDVAFTGSSLDLHPSAQRYAEDLAALQAAVAAPIALVHQVHGDAVHDVDSVPGAGADWPRADAQVSALPGVALAVRVADCVPVVLADPEAGVIGAVHAGRAGIALDVITRCVEAMRRLGASQLTAWIGPHVCGACYEVPAAMREEVAALVPQARARTSWGTPSLDLGAAARAQLEAAGATVHAVGRCTMEDDDLHSYRRDGQDAGRFAGVVWRS